MLQIILNILTGLLVALAWVVVVVILMVAMFFELCVRRPIIGLILLIALAILLVKIL